MRGPNELMEEQKYPIPILDDILPELEGAEIITELDFYGGFNQLEMDEESRELTTFETESGVYRYKYLAFGCKVAPEIFQREMELVLKDTGARNVSDNAIIFAKTSDDHYEKLEKVLQTLEKRNMTLNPDKCKVGMSKLDFLGVNVSGKGVNVTKTRVESIKRFRAPTTVSEVRSFLGVVQFCSKFLPNLGQWTAPLRLLLRKGQKWVWEKEQQDAFDQLKLLVANATELSYFSTKRITKLFVDAGPEGVGAVLTQIHEDGSIKPVAYGSKVLSNQERAYSQTEKEAYAVIWGVEHFHNFLYGHSFIVVTDHKPLEVIYSARSRPSARIERWVLRLQGYNYTVEYVKGTDNVADAFSRLFPLGEKQKKGHICQLTSQYISWVTNQAVPRSLTLEEIKNCTDKDSVLQKVIKIVQSGGWKNHTKDAFFRVRNELTCSDGVLLRGKRIIIPEVLRARTLQICHESHLGVVKMKALIRGKVWWPNCDNDVEKLVKGCIPCQAQGPPEKAEPVFVDVNTEWKPWEHLALDI